METTIHKQKKYIARTYELDEERKALVKKMASNLMTKDEFALAQRQLQTSIMSNAVTPLFLPVCWQNISRGDDDHYRIRG